MKKDVLRISWLAVMAVAALAGQTATTKPDRPPRLVHKAEPVYSEEARSARFEGTALLWVTVDEKGMPTEIRVGSPVGMGLEQKAIEAVQKWRFVPGQKNGKPVAVRGLIEVNFRMAGKSNPRFENAESARSLYNEGVSYLNGDHVPKDEKKAVERFRQAAGKDYAPAQTTLARMYLKGIGVNRDPSQTVSWCLKAAKQNDAAAQTLMGELNGDGVGVAQSDAESFKLYRKAADQGMAAAQFNVGLAYERGKGVAENLKDALKYYRGSADQGFAPAQYQLGVLYRPGKGVDQDLGVAMRWLTASADQAFDPAMNAKIDLAFKMTARDVEEAERMAREVRR